MNKREVEQILLEHGISVKKKFGQNFLLDKNVLTKIATSLNTNESKNTIEIGPGLGFLTNELVKQSENLVLYEIDEEMVSFLSTKSFPGISLPFPLIIKPLSRIKVIAFPFPIISFISISKEPFC